MAVLWLLLLGFEGEEEKVEEVEGRGMRGWELAAGEAGVGEVGKVAGDAALPSEGEFDDLSWRDEEGVERREGNGERELRAGVGVM